MGEYVDGQILLEDNNSYGNVKVLDHGGVKVHLCNIYEKNAKSQAALHTKNTGISNQIR